MASKVAVIIIILIHGRQIVIEECTSKFYGSFLEGAMHNLFTFHGKELNHMMSSVSKGLRFVVPGRSTMLKIM